MNGLKPKAETTPAGSRGGPSQRARTSRLNVSAVIPRKQYSVGRHLAFCVEDDAVQMAAASHVGHRIILHNVRKAYLPASAKTESDRHNLVLEAISEFRREFGGRNPVVSVALSGPETALRTINMPHLKGRELRSALCFEVRQQLPFPPEDCHFDYRIVEKISSQEGKRLNISVLAATRRLVQRQLIPLSEMDLEPSHVYHTQDVVGQLLRSLHIYEDNTAYVLINVKRQRAEISFHRGANLEFLHVSSLGSSFLANRSDPTMFEYFAESLATEIQNSLDYYTGQYSSRFSNQIFVYGDLSYTDDLIDLLSDRFGFEFRRFPAEELDFIRGKQPEYRDSLSVCLPALAAAVNQSRLANLLPESHKNRLKTRKADRFGIIGLFLLAFLLATFWLGATASTNASRKLLGQLEGQVTAFKNTEIFATYQRLKREIARNQAFIDMTSEAPSYLGLNLKELSRLTPKAVRLYDLDYQSRIEGQNYNLAGIVTARETPPELILAEFIENLTASPFYDNVRVEQQVKKRTDNRFELEFNLSMKAII